MLKNIADSVVAEFTAGLIPTSSLPVDKVVDGKLVIDFMYVDGDGIFRSPDETNVCTKLRDDQVCNFKAWARESFHTLPDNVKVSPPYCQSYNAEAERHVGQVMKDVRLGY